MFALVTTLIVFAIMKRGIKSNLGTFDTARSEIRIKEELDELLLQIQEISREHVAKMTTKSGL